MKPQWLINGLGYSAELLYNVVNLAADKSDLFFFPPCCNDWNDYAEDLARVEIKWVAILSC